MKERFEVLDIFRGIFSSLVVFFHMSAFSETPVINNEFVYNADLFVDFFFVLSGFVIAYSYQFISTGSQLGKFFKKRFFRLYPLHFIVLLLFVGIELSKHFAAQYVTVNQLDNQHNNATTFLSNLFLLNSVKLPGVHDVSWNIASWSISAEMIAYFVFGIAVMLINVTKIAAARNVVYVLIVIAAFSSLYYFTGTFELTRSFDYGFLRGITGFFMGVLCFNTFTATKKWLKPLPNSLFSFFEAIALAVTFTFVWYGDTFKAHGYIYEALFFITILIFAFEKGILSAWLKKPAILHETGKLSYSIYMIHTLVLSLFNVVFIRVLKLPPSAYAYLFVVNYLIVFWLARRTFKYIEMRFNLANKTEGKKAWWLW
ncbi:acyltransferase [Mucilaginibacter hurinus]|uniref:Acyltransferase n=1 Tax=Mucilaginibacter hurinus TaxID=2201324 RepID=A0A367GQY2_9SPHI|nr:acyltransferase [Mucilaginibacter hurinus]RCH55123.1 acyltransferase [Mucilaginibacter hurinus]